MATPIRFKCVRKQVTHNLSTITIKDGKTTNGGTSVVFGFECVDQYDTGIRVGNCVGPFIDGENCQFPLTITDPDDFDKYEVGAEYSLVLRVDAG
jgi:hypothetical protein